MLSQPVSLPEEHQKQACGENTTDKSKALSASAILAQQSPALPLPPPRDLWREAFDKLPKSTQQKLKMPDFDQDSQRQHIHELLEVAKKRQAECENQTWKFGVGDHQIVVRDYAVRIVGCLQQVGDIAIKFAPPQASAPWSVVKFVMQIPVIESAQMCALLASTEKIVRILSRGQVYEAVYTIENTPRLALENLQSALVELYSASLELLANAETLFSKNTAKQTVYAIFHPGQTADLFSKLTELETELGSEVQACESGRSAAADARLMHFLRGLDAPLTHIDETVWTLLERVDSKEQLEILEWISATPYGKHHNEVREARTSDTGHWLLQHERFREWGDASSSVILWLRGTAGTGKTFLTSKVIDHVQDSLQSSPNHEGFAYFYCNRNEEERREPLSVLRSYVRQLSTATRNPGDIRKRLRDLCRDARLKGSVLSLGMCKQQLLESVNLYQKTTLVLDALDECEPHSRRELIETIEFVLSRSERPLKVFISSRPDGDIRDRFLSRPNVEIQATHNQGDIEKFVSQEIVKHRRWKKISLSLQERIVKTLLDRSDGMFQWAYLQISQLLDLQTEAAIRSRLGKLPIGLKGAYQEIYGKIAARNEHEKVLADRAFMWVMCSCKPLNSDELLGAIRLDQHNDTFSLADEIDEDLMLDLCSNLLVIDSQRKVWRFSHLSVTEYFEENHWDLREAHCYAAKTCLSLLIEAYKEPRLEIASENSDNDWTENSSIDSQKAPHNIFAPAHPLQIYVRHHWVVHVQANEGQEVDSVLSRLLKIFLGSPEESSVQYRKWYRQVEPDSFREPTTSVFNSIDIDEIAPEHTSLFAMCRFSLYTTLLDWWVTAEIDLSQTNSKGDNLLVLAAVAGSKSICETLVKQGIPVNILLRSGQYGSALAAAAYGGRAEIVRFLVQEEKADVNLLLQSGHYGSALTAAAW
ncbi:hypothetical protein AOQ84DRAFT_386815, partial [Glonium stellatum]